MDIAQPVPFTQARAVLRSKRKPVFDMVLEVLRGAQQMARYASILDSLNRSRLQEMVATNGGGVFLVSDTREEPPLIEAALEEIDAVAPIDTDHIREMYFNDGVQELLPESHGWPCGWDEWDQWSRELDDLDENTRMYVFWTCLRLAEFQTLLEVSERFAWDIQLPDYFDTCSGMDWKKFARKLQKKGLGVMETACDVCMYQTGNLYFDFNPYDDDGATIWDLPSVSIEGVRALQKEWQEAQPILERYNAAQELFQKPGVPAELIKIWFSCFKDEGTRKIRHGRTLAEVFAAERERGYALDDEGEDTDPVIDPFYGPIDGTDPNSLLEEDDNVN